MSLPTDTAYGDLAPAFSPAPALPQRGFVKPTPEPTVIDRRPTFDDTPIEPKPFTAKPLGDYIVVKRIPEPEGLIVEADIAKDKPIRCEVMAVSDALKTPLGNGKYSSPVWEGDKVLIRRFSGTEVKVDDEEYTLVIIQDVLLRL